MSPAVSSLNGKNFEGYADPADGSEGFFYFSDNETEMGQTLNMQLDCAYNSIGVQL